MGDLSHSPAHKPVREEDQSLTIAILLTARPPLATLRSEGLIRLVTLIINSQVSSGAATRFILAVPDEFVGTYLQLVSEMPAETRLVTSVRGFPADANLKKRWAAELGADVWLATRPDLPEIQHIGGPWLAVFADFLLIDYPLHYSEDEFVRFKNAVTQNLPHIARYICFSKYVAERHVQKAFSISESQIDVIAHPVTRCEEFFSKDTIAKLPKSLIEHGDFVRAYFRVPERPWRTILGRRLLDTYVAGLPFEAMDYVFVSTRDRPHKDVLTAVKAVEHLIRRKSLNIKMLTTSVIDPGLEGELCAHVLSNKLIWDVIGMQELPAEVHASIYRLAKLTVHTSPFEGGMPFVFGESLSQGTPCIMARSRVVEETFTPDEVAAFCYEPGAVGELARKIEWGLENREELLSMQMKALARMPQSWSMVGDKYLAAFNAAAQTTSTDTHALSKLPRPSDAGPTALPLKFFGARGGSQSLRLEAVGGAPPHLVARYLPPWIKGRFKISVRIAPVAEVNDRESRFVCEVGEWQGSTYTVTSHGLVDVATTADLGGDVVLEFEAKTAQSDAVRELRLACLSGAYDVKSVAITLGK